ncbi:hypothetical protein LBMAG49_29130 [Planctomycetota bacterium]|nr:hypothetical protein LBMAG49_29130 [Planctomycetota bacterium]
MGLRTTVALLLIVLLLLGALYLTDQKPSDQGSVAVAALGGHTLDRATKLRWQARGEIPFEIHRIPGGPFRITEPLDDLASLAQLRSIAQTYDSAQLSDQQLEDNEVNRKRFGLDEPRMYFAAEFEDGSKERLELGSEGRIGDDMYVRRNGRIYAGGLALWSSLQIRQDDLRERTVLSVESANVTGVSMDQIMGENRSVLTLMRTGDTWQLTAPVVARADPQAANSFLMQVLGLHIDQFPPSVVRLPDRAPDLKITLFMGSNQLIVPMWFDEQKNLFGRLEDRKITFGCVTSQFNAIFSAGTDRLRARVLFPFSNLHTELLTIVIDPGQELSPRSVLHRNSPEENWSIIEPVVSPADPTPVQELISAINSLRALQFYPGGANEPRFGLAQSALQLGVQGREQQQPIFIKLGADAKDGEYEITYAVRPDTPNEVVAVPRDAVQRVRTKWLTYVALEIVRLDQPVLRMDLLRGTAAARVLRRKAEGWVVDGLSAVRPDTGDIVDEIRDLQGKRALSVRSEQLGETDWSLALCRDNGDVFVKLACWDRLGKPLLVCVDSRPDLAFEISALHSDMLRKLWQD